MSRKLRGRRKKGVTKHQERAIPQSQAIKMRVLGMGDRLEKQKKVFAIQVHGFLSLSPPVFPLEVPGRVAFIAAARHV